jgi:L-cysteine:1D-myo-inositol 2-amino-2-deoxy-alpha-D-glucopyranoside ligase
MESWPAPEVSTLVKDRWGPGPAPGLYDAATGRVEPVGTTSPARLYVCGITPYDATHLGHAATYVGFDLLVRAWREAGRDVRYVQNVTDVDDPLLERAREVGIDWQDLATREIQLFREDMTALSVLPPDRYIGVVEAIPLVITLVEKLRAAGAVYDLDGDLYYDVTADPAFGAVSRLARTEMLALSAERGGDPDRPGKRDPLDPLLWVAQRPGEPGWESPFGVGRPGWHVECSAIAVEYLGGGFDVQGGGSDLIFPHHEMSAGHSQAAGIPFARAYAHAGMVGYHGHKMSKSLGNLVLVSQLRADGVDGRAIRLALLAQHYRSDWDWTTDLLAAAERRLEQWQTAVRRGGPDPTKTVEEVRLALADDLDAPRALAAVDAWASSDEPDVAGSGELVAAAVEASLGVSLAQA